MANIKPLPIVLGIVFAAAGLNYLFLGLDLVPDGFMTVIGYLDDAVVMVVLWILFKKAQKRVR